MRESGQPSRDILWAPWREEYILAEPVEGCVFCIDPKEDEERLVLWRGQDTFVFLNLYPYTNGHLLIAPTRHVSDPIALTKPESLGLLDGVRLGLQVLTKAFKPAGFNVGMNLGRIAGAGVEEHLHVHVVPRWQGDTNFMTVLGETRVLCQELRRTYDLLKRLL